MNEAPRNMTFRDYLRVVRERRWLIIIITVVFAGAAFVYTIRQPKIYTAESTVQFRLDNVDPAVPIFLVGLSPQQRATVAARLVTSDAVAVRAKKALRTNLSVKALKASVTPHVDASTLLVLIDARRHFPVLAAQLANVFARAAVDQTQADVRARYKAAAAERRKVVAPLKPAERVAYASTIARLDELAATAQPATVIQPADVPTDPVSPHPVRDTFLGALIGLLVGLIAASVREALDRRFASAREIESQLGLPLVGYVPEEMLGRSVVNSRGRKALTSVDLDAVQMLIANVELLDVDSTPKLVVVTSALADEGKSTVAAAMAGASAALGRHTLLVECDLRKAQLAKRLGLDGSPGLTDYLSGQTALVDVVQKVEFPIASNGTRKDKQEGDHLSFSCIVAGSPVPQPVALLHSEKARQFFEAVTSSYDMVVLDATPVLPLADALQLIPASHAVVMCLRATRTTRGQAEAAAAVLERFPDKPAGIVVTGVRLPEESELYGSSAYAYGGKKSR